MDTWRGTRLCACVWSLLPVLRTQTSNLKVKVRPSASLTAQVFSLLAGKTLAWGGLFHLRRKRLAVVRLVVLEKQQPSKGSGIWENGVCLVLGQFSSVLPAHPDFLFSLKPH